MDRGSTRWRRARGRRRRSSGSSRFSFQSIRSASALLELDFDVHARGQIELAQRVDGLLGRLEDVEQTFMSTNFKMLARLFVHVRRAVDGEALYAGRQRNRTGHAAAGAPDGVHDFANRLIEQAVVVRLEAYAYLVVHPGVPRPIRSALRSISARLRTMLRCPLLQNFRNHAGADRFAALADGEAQPFVHRDRRDQLAKNLDVVARHHHLGALGQREHSGHVGGAKVELRTIAGEERSMAAALVLGQDVRRRLEVGVRGYRAGLREHLSALDVFALEAAQQHADIVAGLALVEQLAEHLDAGDHRLLGVLEADDFDFLADLDLALVDAAGDDGATARDGEHVFNRHQERLFGLALGLRDVGVDGVHEIENRLAVGAVGLAASAVERVKSAAANDGHLVALVIVFGEQVADF